MLQCYLYAPPANDQSKRGIYERLRTALDRVDIFLSTNLDEDIRVDADVLSASRDANAPVLERMDAFVIEGTDSDADVGFLLAHAIALKKPTLYLYQRGTVAKVFNHLSYRELPAWIKVVSYQDQSLEKHVDEFLAETAGRSFKPAPRIKFTLRITSLIDEYLKFKTLNTKHSKADWLREQIEQMMNDDADWAKNLKRRRDNE